MNESITRSKNSKDYRTQQLMAMIQTKIIHIKIQKEHKTKEGKRCKSGSWLSSSSTGSPSNDLLDHPTLWKLQDVVIVHDSAPSGGPKQILRKLLQTKIRRLMLDMDRGQETKRQAIIGPKWPTWVHFCLIFINLTLLLALDQPLTFLRIILSFYILFSPFWSKYLISYN